MLEALSQAEAATEAEEQALELAQRHVLCQSSMACESAVEVMELHVAQQMAVLSPQLPLHVMMHEAPCCENPAVPCQASCTVRLVTEVETEGVSAEALYL